MHVYSWLLSALLLGQSGDPPAVIIHPPTTLPTQTLPGNARPPAAAQARNPRATAEQLLAESLALPPRSTVSGQPLSLLSVLVATPDRPWQLAAVHAYWHLLQSVGDYHYLLEKQQRLGRLAAAKDEAGELRTAQAVAAARLREAEIRLAAAQHELAAAARLAETAALPWPADRPLTEAYRTRLAEMFAGQKPPDRARVLDQTLPLRQRAVEGHAAALLAAEESLDAAIELQAGGQVRLARVLPAMDALLQQQEAFLASVCRYNDDIADYSLTVVPAQTAPQAIVATLIKQARPNSWMAPDATIPAGYEQPPAAPSSAEPAVAPSKSAIPDVPAEKDPRAPRLAPPQESAIPLTPEKPAGEIHSSDARTTRSAYKPIDENASSDNAQVARLVAALYGNRAASPAGENPLRLADCLRTAPANRRLETIEAYWRARQAAASCLLLGEEGRWLDELRPVVMAADPPSPSAMLELRTARLAVAAQRADADADCRAAELQLAVIAGLADHALPQPMSLPFAGRFPLPFVARESGGSKIADATPSWPQRRQEAEIPRWEQAISSAAAAVDEAGATRTAAAADFRGGRTAVDGVLHAIEVQASATAALLDAVADYNRTLAQYVVPRLPPNTAGAALAAALMVGE